MNRDRLVEGCDERSVEEEEEEEIGVVVLIRIIGYWCKGGQVMKWYWY